MSDPRIRDFTEGDYAAIIAVHNRVFVDYPETEEERRRQDALRESKFKWRRWLWEEDGRVLGVGLYLQEHWGYHPRKFTVEVVVDPDARRRGIGTSLYDRVVDAIGEFEPIMLRGMTCEAWPESVRFLESRGYAPGMRMEESRLDIQAFEPAAFGADLAVAKEQGIAIRSWAELEDHPERERKYYRLSQTLLADMPRTEPHVWPEFEVWRERSLKSPRFLPELNLIALDGDDFVGMSNFWGDQVPGRIGTGLTGVLASHRRRGIATALKVRALSAARAASYRSTLTWNAAENAGMLGINRRLGFEPKPAWIEFELDLMKAANTREDGAGA